ncbi:MAG: hypothetical protein ACOYL5_02380 [Phototrophicaceae bacterium]|jgi:hypothetical protein
MAKQSEKKKKMVRTDLKDTVVLNPVPPLIPGKNNDNKNNNPLTTKKVTLR